MYTEYLGKSDVLEAADISFPDKESPKSYELENFLSSIRAMPSAESSGQVLILPEGVTVSSLREMLKSVEEPDGDSEENYRNGYCLGSKHATANILNMILGGDEDENTVSGEESDEERSN